MTADPAAEAVDVEKVIGQVWCLSDIGQPSTDGFTYLNDDARKLLKDIARALTAANARADEAERERDEAQKSLAVCRESLIEQADARADPTMPILTPEVLEQIRADAEAQYACAETKEDRIAAHGLSLLCDWQARAFLARIAGGR